MLGQLVCSGNRLGYPLAGFGERRVAIWHVHAFRLPLGNPAGVLRFVIQRKNARGEPIALALEDVFARGNVEQPRHEIFGGRVLLEAAGQVGDRHLKLFRVNHGSVEKQAADALANRSRDVDGHALEHLEVDVLADPALFGEQMS